MSEGDFTGMDAGEYYAMRDFEALERSHNSEVDKDKKIRNQRIEIEHLKNKIREIKQSRDHFKRHYEQSSAKLEGLTPKWISVEERLPEVGEKVLICHSHEGHKSISICSLRKSFLRDDELGGFIVWSAYTKNVTHWMLLPEPPKGDNDGT